MLAFAIFAVVLVVGMIALVFYLYPGAREKPSTVPGLDPSDAIQGNLPDISQAGSLHEFLVALHGKFGDIASFWWGQQYVVSLARGDLLSKESAVFDRPVELFLMFEPLVGRQCLQYANGAEGRMRRQLYDRSFTYDRVAAYQQVFLQCGKEVAEKWKESAKKKEHIPLAQYMLAMALKSASEALFGAYFKDRQEILEFKKNYELCWEHMENTLRGKDVGSRQVDDAAFRTFRDALYSSMRAVIKHRKDNPPTSPQDRVFLDDILDSEDITDEVKLLDSLIFAIGSFHTTGNLMTWCLYYLSEHPDIQEKVLDELNNVLKPDQDLTPAEIPDLTYTRQVIDESLRCGVVAPFAARVANVDREIGGHVIPRDTPVVHALGVLSVRDEWGGGEPDVFDPENFASDRVRTRHPCDFLPFGGPGKRICPGKSFSYTEAFSFLSVFIRQFKFSLVPGQLVEQVHGLVTHPGQEIWIMLEER